MTKKSPKEKKRLKEKRLRWGTVGDMKIYHKYVGDKTVNTVWQNICQNPSFYAVEDDKDNLKLAYDMDNMAVFRSNMCAVAPIREWGIFVKLFDGETIDLISDVLDTRSMLMRSLGDDRFDRCFGGKEYVE